MKNIVILMLIVLSFSCLGGASISAADSTVIPVAKVSHDEKKKQYVNIDIPNANVKVQYKYANTEDRVIELARVGLNGLFSFSKLHKIDMGQNTIYPSGVLTGLTTIQTFDTDIIGPIMVSAEENEDGDDPIAAFTGGWHGFNRDQSGSPTARHVSLQVWADGEIVKGTYEGYCDNLVIRTISNIQGFNTKKKDGSGREVIQQEVTTLFKEGRAEVHIRMIPLELVRIHTYYGLQSSISELYAGGLIHYVNGDSQGLKDTALGPNDSGKKSAYPNVDRMTIRNKSKDEIVVWMDRQYGLGQKLNVKDDYPSAFFVGYKSYFNLVNGIPLILAAGQPAEVHGGFAWVKGIQNNADLYTKILRNGIMWNVIDFLQAGTEINYPTFDQMFTNANAVENFQKDPNIKGFTKNYFYAYAITSTGYGSYWFRFKE